MNNARAKTILIVFFLLTNLCLFILLMNSYSNYIRVPEEIITTTVNLLLERGIDIDSSLFPSKIGKQKQIVVNNVIETYEDFAKLILMEEPIIENGVFKTDTASVNFYGDRFRITYHNGLETSTKDRSPADKVRTFLSAAGIDTDGASVSSDNNAEGIFTVTFRKAFYKKPFFDCVVTAELKGTKIMTVHGSWFNKEEVKKTLLLSPVTSLLVNYSAKNPGFRDVRITSLKPGYAICENGVFHKQVTLIPVYEVTADNKDTFYIDARGN